MKTQPTADSLSDTLAALSAAADGLSAVIKLISHELEGQMHFDESLTLAINALNSAQGSAEALADRSEQVIRSLDGPALDFSGARALVVLREALTAIFGLEAVLELAKLNLQTGKDGAALQTLTLALDGAAYWAGELADCLLLPAVNSPASERFAAQVLTSGAEDLA